MATTETLDKLYLEWSQFTSARTAREIRMEKALRNITENLGTDDPACCVALAALEESTDE